MSDWLGGWLDADESGGGGGPSFPAEPTGTTTAAAIRDRMLTVIEELVPDTMSGRRFQRYRAEGGGDFVAWAEQQPAASLRRFSVRHLGATTPPIVSNTDIERVRMTFEVVVAYPQTQRYGDQAALDRDDAAELDQLQIRNAIGLHGGENFIAPYPPASFVEGQTAPRIEGQAVDFYVIRQVMEFTRDATG